MFFSVHSKLAVASDNEPSSHHSCENSKLSILKSSFMGRSITALIQLTEVCVSLIKNTVILMIMIIFPFPNCTSLSLVRPCLCVSAGENTSLMGHAVSFLAISPSSVD